MNNLPKKTANKAAPNKCRSLDLIAVDIQRAVTDATRFRAQAEEAIEVLRNLQEEYDAAIQVQKRLAAVRGTPWGYEYEDKDDE